MRNRRHRYCLPCRRSRVRIPSAALKKACICRPFLRAQSACASASGRTDSGLAAGRLSAVPRKAPRFAGRFWFVRTEALLRACRRSSVPPAAAVAGLFLQTARFLRMDACRRAASESDSRGESGFSPDTVRPTLCPAQRPRRAMTPTARTHRRRRPRQRRGVRHGRLGRGNRSGSIAEAVAYVGSGHLPATEQGSCSSSL